MLMCLSVVLFATVPYKSEESLWVIPGRVYFVIVEFSVFILADSNNYTSQCWRHGPFVILVILFGFPAERHCYLGRVVFINYCRTFHLRFGSSVTDCWRGYSYYLRKCFVVLLIWWINNGATEYMQQGEDKRIQTLWAARWSITWRWESRGVVLCRLP